MTIETIETYHQHLSADDRAICGLLHSEISAALPEAQSKLWHGHPVWFLAGNPIVGYSKQKAGIRLMFWSGMSFEEPELQPGTGKFKDASRFYTSADQIERVALGRWLDKARRIQWDYGNLIRKRRLERLF